jgi:hypothetical protein
MCRYGGGPNPHFALALGAIMLRVGQRHIAWCACERAANMADTFWPDREVQRGLVNHCRARQQLIEDGLHASDRDGLRPRFQAELKYGKDYQTAYQEYEAERIGAGDSIEDAHFYDAFFATHATIATPVGSEEKFIVIGKDHFRPRLPLPSVLFFAGLTAFLGDWLLRLRSRRE